MNPHANTVKLKARRQGQIIKALDGLPVDLQASVKLLFELLAGDGVQEICIDNLNSLGQSIEVKVKKNNVRDIDTLIQFDNWSVVRWVLNDYLLPLIENSERFEGETYFAEGCLELFNLDDLSQPPCKASVNVIAPLDVRSFAVTIVREA